MATLEREASGASQVDARHAARRELGNLTRVKEDVRAVWRNTSMEQLLQDLRIATRGLKRSPGFSLTVVGLIALGIGVNGTAFSLFHGIMNKPLVGVTAENLVSLGVAIDGREADPGNSWQNYLDYVESSKTLRRITARGFERFVLTLDAATYAVRGGLVTQDYFRTLGVDLALGRSFAAADESGGASLVTVISYRMWQEQFAGSDKALGQSVLLNRQPVTVIGVAPQGFRGVQLAERNDVWVPIVTYCRMVDCGGLLTERSYRAVELVGQLGEGASLENAQAELDFISERLEATYPDTNRRFRALVRPYTAIGPGIGPSRLALNLLLVVAGLLLIVITANVVNLAVFRSIKRRHEIAVRKALGAPLVRILRLPLAEGLLLALIAASAGWWMSSWTGPFLLSLIPTGPPALDLSPDTTVAAYALFQAVLLTVAFVMLPAWRVWRGTASLTLRSRESEDAPPA
jgi:predicted permease